MTGQFADVTFENELTYYLNNTDKQNKTITIILDLFSIGHHDTTYKKFDFKEFAPNLECEVTGDELLNLIGPTLEVANQRIDNDYLKRYNRKREPRDYDKKIELFYEELKINPIKTAKIELRYMY